jgi:hypothetical protein
MRAENLRKQKTNPLYDQLIKDYGEEALENMDPDQLIKEKVEINYNKGAYRFVCLAPALGGRKTWTTDKDVATGEEVRLLRARIPYGGDEGSERNVRRTSEDGSGIA